MSLTILKADPAVLLRVSPLENYMHVYPRRPIPGSVALVITKLGRTEDWPRALGIYATAKKNKLDLRVMKWTNNETLSY